LSYRFDYRCTCGEPRPRRCVEDRVCGTDIQTVATARAGGNERDLRQSTRRSEIPLRHNAAFGTFRHFLHEPTERGTKEVTTIRLPFHKGGKPPLKSQPS
jgi:hypothetical protein